MIYIGKDKGRSVYVQDDGLNTGGIQFELKQGAKTKVWVLEVGMILGFKPIPEDMKGVVSLYDKYMDQSGWCES